MNKKKLFLSLTFILVLGFCYFNSAIEVYATTYGDEHAAHCQTVEFDDKDFPVSSIRVNNYIWTDKTDEYRTDNNVYVISILAGKKGEEFPDVSLPGDFSQNGGSIVKRPNPNASDSIVGDEYILTITLDNMPYNGTNGSCSNIILDMMPGPEPTDSKTGNLNVTINGTDLEWHEPSDEASHFTFAINNSEMIFLKSDNLTFTRDGDNKITRGATINPEQLEYSYDYSGTVTFHMHTTPSEYVSSIVINDHEYPTPKTREQLIAAYDKDCLCIDFDIPNVTYAETYNITIEGVRLTGDDQLTGGFGWNYSSEGDVDGASDRIPHGLINFVRATYNNVEYTTIDELRAAGDLFEWTSGVKKEHYEIGDRDGFGYAFFPVGTVVTVQIVPEQGYQLVGLKEDHRNVTRGEQVGVYTFEIHGGGEALGAVFEAVDNELRTSSNKVVGGQIDTDAVVQNGTLKLEVKDVNVSNDSKTGFENSVANSGYEINNYLDLSLFNTVYKGVKDANNQYYLAWDTPIENLTKNATITLELDEDMKGKDIVVIHERHTGEQVDGYDVIDEVNYNEQNNTISFGTSSFSNYAIAVKNTNEEQGGNDPVEDPNVTKYTVTFDTKGGSDVPSQEIVEGELPIRPENDPTYGDLIFAGWYSTEDCRDEYDFEHGVITAPTTIHAKWVEAYKVEDESGNSIEFNQAPNSAFNLRIFDFMSYTKEEILSMFNATSDEYDAILNVVKENSSKEGTFITFFEIDVLEDENGNGIIDSNEDHYIEEGPLRIRIKMTDEMKKFNTFKLGYLNNQYEVAEIIELTVDGDYLVGTLPHLSTYTLVGSITETPNPSTLDNINHYVSMFTISMIGLAGSALYIYRKRYN